MINRNVAFCVDSFGDRFLTFLRSVRVEEGAFCD